MIRRSAMSRNAHTAQIAAQRRNLSQEVATMASRLSQLKENAGPYLGATRQSHSSLAREEGPGRRSIRAGAPNQAGVD
jgi:hypothetical protein